MRFYGVKPSYYGVKMKINKIFKSQNWDRKLLVVQFLGVFFLTGYQIIIMIILGTPPTSKGILVFILDFVLYYVNLYWIVPLFIKRGKRIEIIFRIALLVLIQFIVSNWLAFHPSHSTNFLNFLFSIRQLFLSSWQIIQVLGYGYIVGFFQLDKMRSLEKQRLEFEKFEAIAEKEKIENTLIQMQLNRHTIFNGLSYIKSHTEEVLPEVGNTVGLFAEIVRYSLLDIRRINKVPLSQELAQISNHINFHELLSGKKYNLAVIYHIDMTVEEPTIPPSLLLTLVENILRYGVLHDPIYPATLSIKYEENNLEFRSLNFKKRTIVSGSGMGIKSARSILEYYYKGKYQLDITDLEDTYMLCLTIQI